MIMDPRFGSLDGHTWFYVVDLAGRDVVVVGTRDNKVVTRWKNLADPRGLGIQFSGLTLYVTNFTNNTVSAIDIGRANVGATSANDVTKSLDTKEGGALAIEVGRGPLGAAHAPDGAFLFVANQLDNTCTVINSSTFQATTTFPIGTNPQQVAATFYFTGIGRFAYITCKGGGADENGSVALYWDLNNSLQANITGFTNPEGIQYDYNLSGWVANSGGDSCAQLTLAVVGGGFAATILPSITADIPVGKNPTDCTVDPYFTLTTLVPRCVITADRGSGQLSFIDALQPSRPGFTMSPFAGVSQIMGYMDQ
jgi:YVTN family beta-propeller protein